MARVAAHSPEGAGRAADAGVTLHRRGAHVGRRSSANLVASVRGRVVRRDAAAVNEPGRGAADIADMLAAREQPDWVDLRRVASGQAGYATERQLASRGFDRHRRSRLVDRGVLVRDPGRVFRLGPPPRTLAERCWWAVLAVGHGAIVCGETAAQLHRLIRGPDDLTPLDDVLVHVLLVGRSRRRSPCAGIRLHSAKVPRGALRTGPLGLPITDVPWTVADLAATAGAATLRDAVRGAIADHHAEPHRLRVLARPHGGRGALRLRSALDLVADPALLRADGPLEAVLIQRCREAGLPGPASNVPLLGHVVDLLWEPARLVVETDGRRGHLGTDRQIADAARDDDLRRAGYETIRLGSDDVGRRLTWVIETLRRRLG